MPLEFSETMYNAMDEFIGQRRVVPKGLRLMIPTKEHIRHQDNLGEELFW